METKGVNPRKTFGHLHFGSQNSINKHFGEENDVDLRGQFHVWKFTRSADEIALYFNEKLLQKYSRGEMSGWGAQFWESMFDSPMRFIINIAVGGDFAGIGNERPAPETWDKPTMEVDYIRVEHLTSTEELIALYTVETSCWETPACGDGGCHTCKDRVSWLKDNTSHNTNELALAHLKTEFPDGECDCDLGKLDGSDDMLLENFMAV